MIESDKIAFREMMMGVGELYSKDITKPLLQIYFGSLVNFSLEQVSNGVSKHAGDPKHGTFMPKPADIIRQIEADKPSTESRAELAWMTIEKKMSSVGAYGSLKLDDLQALAAAQSLGSWRDLCHTDTDKLQWKRKEFIEAYKNFENTPLEALPSHLAGMIEMDRSKKDSKPTFMSDLVNKIGVNK